VVIDVSILCVCMYACMYVPCILCVCVIFLLRVVVLYQITWEAVSYSLSLYIFYSIPQRILLTAHCLLSFAGSFLPASPFSLQLVLASVAASVYLPQVHGGRALSCGAVSAGRADHLGGEAAVEGAHDALAQPRYTDVRDHVA
jgi:hypothetical protein